MEEEKPFRNWAKCPDCETVIESLSQYDHVACPCFTSISDEFGKGIALDGGPVFSGSRILGNIAGALDPETGEVLYPEAKEQIKKADEAYESYLNRFKP